MIGTTIVFLIGIILNVVICFDARYQSKDARDRERHRPRFGKPGREENECGKSLVSGFGIVRKAVPDAPKSELLCAIPAYIVEQVSRFYRDE